MTRIFPALSLSAFQIPLRVATLSLLLSFFGGTAFASLDPISPTITRMELLKAGEMAKDLPANTRFSFTEGSMIANCQTLELARGQGHFCEFIFGEQIMTITDLEFKSIDCALGIHSTGTQVRIRLGEQTISCEILSGDPLNYSCTLQ